jgi:hypothetical protein
LTFIAKFGYIEEKYISQYIKLSPKYCQRLLKTLTNQGLLVRQKILATHDFYLYLTPSGAKYLNLKTPAKPVLNTLVHDSMLVKLYLYFINNDINIITSDKELKRINNKLINNKFRLPDLLINNDIAIELELTQKNDMKLTEIIHSYILDPQYNKVVYIINKLSVFNKITAIINNISDKFYFYLLDANQDTNNLQPLNTQLSIIELLQTTPSTNNCKQFGNFTYIKFDVKKSR